MVPQLLGISSSSAEIWIYILASILLRLCVSLGPYSGKGKSPMYGDYEAQRHWQEITFNLPIQDWYTNSSLNDLQYWGLDYPPLTAYHSYVCGWLASKIDMDWVKLGDSRGIESNQHKLFMRITVLVADFIIFYTAVFAISRICKRDDKTTNNGRALLLLGVFYPGLVLIDHGHFQYNCISLGFMLWMVFCFERDSDVLGSVAFCLALNYKQMELYHALPVFFFLLGKALSRPWDKCILKLAQLGITVILSFVILWLPFLSSFESITQVVGRLFPFNRGLFEDKVANVWCSISPVIKIKKLFDQTNILRLCSCSTLLLSLPSCLHLMFHPNVKALKLSLVNVSLMFFLFSYQVHEKSILISAVSAILICEKLSPYLVVWFLHMTTFSMSPLLTKDGLMMQQYTSSVLFLFITMLCFWHHNHVRLNKQGKFHNVAHGLYWMSIICTYLLGIISILTKPPEKYPDIFPVLISIFSCAAFLLSAACFHVYQFVPNFLT
uniref:dolichyl pyrophosphate Man9GlcNAc2 alpha-1,3-glucosyltransferase-like n=1 Tax=Ciona intestinalis TaxID=7719 RepID=UPI000180B9F0|nr:dolichyl pyrophosphate Man9GlcNAc2 alpha-1,3-glucosyltransferase-like [Ciona intestinalis]|eukprot:XP_002129715.1 dolichyl pyrophosphate Man9GlcNAc2 alpha-1,3-glucosyltransferase-like [Ciona intestinalis]